MTQRELEQALMEVMQLSRKQTQYFLKALTQAIQQSIYAGGIVALPRFGTFYTRIWLGRDMHNPHTGGTYHPSAKRVMKMSRYGLPTQTLTPGWRPTYTYQDIRQYPTSKLAVRMFLIERTDLNLCNKFIYELVDIMIAAMVTNDPITIRGIGRWTAKTWIARTYHNPRTGMLETSEVRTQVKFRQSAIIKYVINH